MMSEIETSISFCGLEKIHSTIINMEILRGIVEQSTDLDFLESVNLVKSHCKLQKNSIEYLIEIPVYNSKETKLFQITPIPIFRNCLFCKKTQRSESVLLGNIDGSGLGSERYHTSSWNN